MSTGRPTWPTARIPTAEGDSQMASTKDSSTDTNEKVPNTEYRAGGQTLKVGDTASKTVYLDDDGKLSSSAPERGTVLVVEGDTITQAMVDRARSAADGS
jgi:hypothetical protein